MKLAKTTTRAKDAGLAAELWRVSEDVASRASRRAPWKPRARSGSVEA